MPILEIEHLQKGFKDVTVLKGLNLSVEKGCVYGFIGKNGAGKTTTMRIITGLLKPDGGTVRVNGKTVAFGETPTNRVIGYLPDVPEFYGFMNAWEYLAMSASITRMERGAAQRKARELIGVVGLEDGAKRRIKGYSRGMKQRLGIAQALLHDPLLLVCDEPTSALDPQGRAEVLQILEDIKERTTVLFSTHILADVERICDSIGILEDGRLKLEGGIRQIREAQGRPSVQIAVDSQAVPYERFKALADELAALPFVRSAKESSATLILEIDSVAQYGPALLARLAAASDVRVLSYKVVQPSLESLYLEVIA
jgi:ABC-2 type transport system ATP-binding protein